MRILVAGGLGFIGSHVAMDLIENGFDVLIVDSLHNSSLIRLKNMKKIVGKDIQFFEIDVRSISEIEKIFDKQNIDGIVNCLHVKYLGEKDTDPLFYYQNNLMPALNMVELANKYDIKFFINSSKSSIYDQNTQYPYFENDNIKTNNPSDTTRYMTEIMLDDVCSNSSLESISLRYSTPSGAHKSGLIGSSYSFLQYEFISYVYGFILGKIPSVIIPENINMKNKKIISDYIHISDLSMAYVNSINYILQKEHSGKPKGSHTAINIGSSIGYDIHEIISKFEILFAKKILTKQGGYIYKNINIVNNDLAKKILGRQPNKNILSIIEDGRNHINNINN